MKQCNGFYGCTLCNQRGIHVAGSHRYPHNESFQMRSFDAHMQNIQELERGSVDELRVELGRKADCEIKTLVVKGRSNRTFNSKKQNAELRDVRFNFFLFLYPSLFRCCEAEVPHYTPPGIEEGKGLRKSGRKRKAKLPEKSRKPGA